MPASARLLAKAAAGTGTSPRSAVKYLSSSLSNDMGDPGTGASSWSADEPPSSNDSNEAGDSCADFLANRVAVVDAAAPSSDKIASSVERLPVHLRKLPTDFDDMLRALEETWEIGDVSRNQAPKKTLIQGSQDRTEIRKSHPFGRASSSMLCKRRATSNSSSISGVWIGFGELLRNQKAKSESLGKNVVSTDVYSFSIALRKKPSE